MTYNILSHRHRFSVWASARASQRGFTTVKILVDSLEKTNLEEFCGEFYKDQESKNKISQDKFDKMHSQWVNQIAKEINKISDVNSVPYGRIAKLVNMYLKCMIVLIYPENRLSKIIHPPIDRILLRSLAKISTKHKKLLLETNWTQLSEEDYFKLIDIFRADFINDYFWKIEENWSPI